MIHNYSHGGLLDLIKCLKIAFIMASMHIKLKTIDYITEYNLYNRIT